MNLSGVWTAGPWIRSHPLYHLSYQPLMRNVVVCATSSNEVLHAINHLGSNQGHLKELKARTSKKEMEWWVIKAFLTLCKYYTKVIQGVFVELETLWRPSSEKWNFKLFYWHLSEVLFFLFLDIILFFHKIQGIFYILNKPPNLFSFIPTWSTRQLAGLPSVLRAWQSSSSNVQTLDNLVLAEILNFKFSSGAELKIGKNNCFRK